MEICLCACDGLRVKRICGSGALKTLKEIDKVQGLTRVLEMLWEWGQ